MPSVDDSIQFVKGIGPKKAKLLEKLHIRTLRDALETYPRDYEDRTHITPIAEIDMEDKYAVRAVVGTEPKVNRIRKGLTLVKCTIYDETGTLNVTYFNNPYAAAQLRVGQEYVFYGKVQGYGRGRTMVSPQSEKVAPDADHPGRIVPVYPLTAGLTQRDLERVTAAALDTLTGEWPDPLPELLRAKYRLPDAVDALSAIHRPKTKDDVAQARRRMVFEELFLLCCGLQQLKERRKADSGIVFTSNGLDSFFEALPFTPTGAQRRAIMEIAADCASGRPMNRLVQGDVGSGKTVVAAGLCALAAQNGWQAAFMAPTEILAAQHAETLAPMLDKLGIYRSEALVRTAYEICRWHHERWDGRGYPDGLSGDRIPISAQVVSMADVYDALVSKRVYKAAYAPDTAVQMILHGDCGTFNPLLLECLVEIQDVLKADVTEAE